MPQSRNSKFNGLKCVRKEVHNILLPTITGLMRALLTIDHSSAAVWDVRKLTGYKSSLQTVRFSRTMTSAYFSPLTGRKILMTSFDNYIRLGALWT